jgi:hypothetical protein
MLAPYSENTELRPIFAATDEFMGCWLKEQPNGIQNAWKIYSDAYKKDTGDWKKFIQMTGFQWYRYSDLKTYAP